MLLVAGGVSEDTSTSELLRGSAEIYDPAGPGRAGRWTMTGKMKAFRMNHTATLLSDGSVLVAGGESKLKGEVVHLASAEIYEPTVKQNGPVHGSRSPAHPTVPAKR